ncbi:hypothetical protein [Nodularia sp. UHCC 0506]|uniref:hypothetical protein n=1 Tax=Nodularia sp. UHCC 0506 TaxID=3110243 RepID=UPI00139BE127|nr:hypothetical protein [Nodularia sp. UHCC 0506]MEA5516569.1 hypothetical protein [Nodularia sp. UHCC 0506]TVP65584.1 MAG: hypothetical protein EA343_02805 [Nodularia sp. (in: cyanobacteria)]
MKPRRCKHSTDYDLFLDFPATKSHLAELLGVARSTLVTWENIAFWRITSFRDAYPKKADGSRDRESPLSPYQAWVLSRVGRLMAQLRRSERVRGYILQNPNDFSKYSYTKAQKQLAKIGA